MKKYLVAMAITAALSLSACESTTGTATDEPVRGSNASEKKEVEPETPAIPTFGQQVETGDLAITVSEPQEFQPTRWAAGGEKSDYSIRFTVTVLNNGTTPYEPVELFTTLQSGNEESEEIFDTDSGLEGSPMTPVLPGREVTFDIGYGVNNMKDLVLNVSPSFTTESVLFTS